MSKPKVFISHSAKTTSVQDIRNRLFDSLTDEGFPVLLDQKGIDLGQNWRAILNLWIGGCDAAIVLLCEDALKSSYVAYETSILTYRKDCDEDFLLIPIFIDPVDEEAIQSSRLEPSRIHDIQSVLKKVSCDQIVRDVIDKLKTLHQKETPIDKSVKHLRYILKGVDPEILEEEANKLSIALGPWDPKPDVAKSIAMKMMGVGLEGSKETIRRLRRYLPEPKNVSIDEMVDLVASSWVDYRSVVRIPKIAESDWSIGVNGENPLTAKMYVIRACDFAPSDSWPVVQVDGVYGEDAIDDLVRSIYSSLSNTLKPGDIQEIDVHEIDAYLDNLHDHGEPVFIALPFAGINHKLIEGLKKKFSGVTFFLLTGTKIPEDTALEKAKVEFLRPELEPGSEINFCNQYKNDKAWLKRKY